MSALLPPVSRRLSHAARRGWHYAADGPREMPRYFITGVKRAGTTSLDEYLTDHPLVMRGLVEKGSRYYDVNYQRGPEWFHRHLPLRRTVDRLERELGARPIVGESSPYYAFHPYSAARIAADVPQARLLLCLREPVERAWSHYRYEVARGFEKLSFDDALAAESDRLAVTDDDTRWFNHRHFSYAARSRYAEQVARLHANFPRENLLVVQSERLFADPRTVMDQVFKHVGLPSHHQGTYLPHKPLPPEQVPEDGRRFLGRALEADLARLDDVLDVVPTWR